MQLDISSLFVLLIAEAPAPFYRIGGTKSALNAHEYNSDPAP